MIYSIRITLGSKISISWQFLCVLATVGKNTHLQALDSYYEAAHTIGIQNPFPSLKRCELEPVKDRLGVPLKSYRQLNII